jgi:hypothetical protein
MTRLVLEAECHLSSGFLSMDLLLGPIHHHLSYPTRASEVQKANGLLTASKSRYWIVHFQQLKGVLGQHLQNCQQANDYHVLHEEFELVVHEVVHLDQWMGHGS